MAYNRRNILQRIIDIQELTMELKDKGVTQEFIFWEHIYPKYRISKTTYYNYLATNAKAEMKKLLEKKKAEKAQLNLF